MALVEFVHCNIEKISHNKVQAHTFSITSLGGGKIVARNFGYCKIAEGIILPNHH